MNKIKIKCFSLYLTISIGFMGGVTTVAQNAPKPFFYFGFDGHIKDSLRMSTLEVGDTFIASNPVVEATNANFAGHSLINYRQDKKSYVIRSPALNYERFTVAVRFKPQILGEMNIVTGGFWLRWFTMFIDDFGTPCIGFNNERIVEKLPVKIRTDKWNWIVCRVDLEQRTVKTYVNGKDCAVFELPDGFQLSPLSEKWRNKFQKSSKHWMFDNRGNGRLSQADVDEFMVFDSLVSPEVAVGFSDFIGISQLVLGDQQISAKDIDEHAIANLKRRITNNLAGASLPPTHNGLIDFLTELEDEAKSNSKVAGLIKSLGAKKYLVREAATFRLRLLGLVALKQIEDTFANVSNPEIAYRSRILLNEIQEPGTALSDVDCLLEYMRIRPSNKLVPYLFLSLSVTNDDARRTKICESLMVSTDRANEAYVENRLNDENKWVRLAALWMLPKVKPTAGLKPILVSRLADPDDLVRLSALSILTRNGIASHDVPMKGFLESDDWKIRIIAQQLLRRMASNQIIHQTNNSNLSSIVK